MAVGIHEATVSYYIKYLANEIIGNFDTFRQTIPLGSERNIELEAVARKLMQIVDDQNMLAAYNNRRREIYREASKPNLRLHVSESSIEFNGEEVFLANTPIRHAAVDEKINGASMPFGVEFEKLSIYH